MRGHDVAEYIILITAQDLTVAGDPIACWTSIDVTLKFNEPGSGLFTAPGYAWIRQQMSPGNRVVVIRDGKVILAGPIEKWQYERSDDGDNAGDGVLTVNFADDLALVVARLTYPNPALTPSAQTTDNWTFSGSGEAALYALVNGNAGPAALPGRAIPKLTIGTVAGLGGTVTSQADRMEPLGDVLRRVAVSAGGLGFRTQQVGSVIQFQVYQPSDLSNQVFFSFGLGNLKYISYEVTAPTATAAIVGGQGEGADRFLIERVSQGQQDLWGRMETLVNRPGTDPVADLNAGGDEEQDSKAETARVPASASDTPFQRYGVHYDVGARVSVETWPGSMISDVVATVHIQVYPTAGEVVSPTIGSQAESSDPAWVQRLHALTRRVGYLERNTKPAAV
jgi:hypothetical protein